MKRNVFPKKGDRVMISIYSNGKKIEDKNAIIYYSKKSNLTQSGTVGIISFKMNISIPLIDDKITSFENETTFDMLGYIKFTNNNGLLWSHGYYVRLYPKDEDGNLSNLKNLYAYFGMEYTSQTTLTLVGDYPEFYFTLKKED